MTQQKRRTLRKSRKNRNIDHDLVVESRKWRCILTITDGACVKLVKKGGPRVPGRGGSQSSDSRVQLRCRG